MFNNKMKLSTLQDRGVFSPSRSTIREGAIPSYVIGLKFLGYDSSGVTRDPKGILRLSETSTRGRDAGFPNLFDVVIPDYKNILFDRKEAREHRVGRTTLDAEVITLAEAIQEINESPYIDYDFSSKKRSRLDRFNMLRDVQQQVTNSLEDPRVYRESRGRLVGNPTIDGVEFTVDMAWVQEQIGEGTLPYFLKGDEYVVARVGDNRKVLANRYFNDPRVVVAGTFEGDVRRPQNYSPELDNETKGRLTKLFRQLAQGVNEVTFPDHTRIKTD